MKFSFLSPAYNSEQWIQTMLDSIPKEYAYEIIVCDDASTDNTLEILTEYQKKCPQLKILINENSMGASYSYNRSIAEATGDYVGIIDSEDIYLPTISEVLSKIDGQYDIYYYNMLTKIGQRFIINEENRYGWCGQFKVIKRNIIGDSKFTDRKGIASHCDFNRAILDKNPSRYFTGIFAYWHNSPRDNS